MTDPSDAAAHDILEEWSDPLPERPHEREIFRKGGRYVMCQVLNWREGPPPKYLVCNPLSGHGAGQLFLAHQGLGTWMEADLYAVADELNKV